MKIILFLALFISSEVFAVKRCKEIGIDLWNQEMHILIDGNNDDYVALHWSPLDVEWTTAMFRPGSLGIASSEKLGPDLAIELVYILKDKTLLRENYSFYPKLKKPGQFNSNFIQTKKHLASFLDNAFKKSQIGKLELRLKRSDKIICTFEQEVFVAIEQDSPEDSL